MPGSHDPREFRIRHRPAQAVRPPFEKINRTLRQPRRLTGCLGRVHDSNDRAGLENRNYGVAFGLGTRICCILASAVGLG